MEECNLQETPDILSKKIREFEEELKKYVSKKLIKYGKNKVLVTIPRKGHIIIDHLKHNSADTTIRDQLEETFTRIVSAEEFFEMGDLYTKEIIIFDDAVDEGHKIDAFLKKFQEKLNKTDEEFLDFRKKNIKIGAFVVNGRNYSKLITKGILNKELVGNGELEGEKFLNKILDIITYLIHTGDIIDPDHLLIKGTFKESVRYSSIWTILKNTNDKLYEADFSFYHPEKKKVTLYDVPYSEWIDVKDLNIVNEKFQCKVRFVFDLVRREQDLFVKDFMIAPVINPKIKFGLLQSCTNFENQFCRKFQKQPHECCVDCTLYELITKVMHGFMKKWYESIEKNKSDISIKGMQISWNHLNYAYKNSFSSDILEERILKF